MLTITRRQAQQFRNVFRRACGQARKDIAIGFFGSAEGLTMKSASGDVAVECRIPGVYTPETRWLPFQFLADCEAKNDDLVTIESIGKTSVTAQWTDHGVPQSMRYDCAPPESSKFPAKPTEFAENPHHLLKALIDASEVCDPDSTRYALACLQLRGTQGSIVATDGRQLMQLSSFTFPWDGDLLIPRNKIFASPELADDHPILVGKEGDWVVFQCGPSWTIWLAINKDGRFPDVTRHIPQPTDATARCQLSPADADFLGQALPRLPSNETDNSPITMDLNGSIAVRAYEADLMRPTEVVLINSTRTGEPIRLNSNRKFLARALKLGFRELCIYDNKSPVACFDDDRIFAWAVLDPESIIKPSADAVRIESPRADSSAPTIQSKTKPKTERKPRFVNEPITTNGHTVKTDGPSRLKKANPQDMATLIEQATKLRAALHSLMHNASELISTLKQHRRQNRALESTISQLRTLKTFV